MRTIFDSSWLRLPGGIRSSPSALSRVVALLLPWRATSIIDAAGVGCDRSTVSRHCSMIHGDSRPTRSRGNRCGKAIRSCSYIHSCYASAMRNRAPGNKLRPASHQPLFPVITAIIFAFWHARCGLASRPRNARPGREVFPASVSERLGENSQAHRPAAARRPAPCR